MYLVIDTTNKQAAVGIYVGKTLALSKCWDTNGSHTAELMPAIQDLFSAGSTSVSDLEGVVVAKGPGGFSTLRAGLSVAKVLAFSLSVPLVGISTLEAIASLHRDSGVVICPLLDTGRNLVAWARFSAKNGNLVQFTSDRVTELEAVTAYKGRHTLFCGETLSVHKDRLKHALGARAHFVESGDVLSRLSGLMELGITRLIAGESDSLAALQPHYLRSPTISKPRPIAKVRYGAIGRQI